MPIMIDLFSMKFPGIAQSRCYSNVVRLLEHMIHTIILYTLRVIEIEG